jgi:hypothetical protein
MVERGKPRRNTPANLTRHTIIIADKAYDADRLDPTQEALRLDKAHCRQRSHAERFLNNVKQSQRIAIRYEKLGPLSWLSSAPAIWLKRLSTQIS